MALKPIQFKRSEVVGKKPSSSDLQVGELAFNIVDRRIYTKNKAGVIVELANTVDVPLNLVGTTTNSTLSVQGTSKTATFATSQTTTNGTVGILATVAATTGNDYSTPSSRVVQDSVRVSIAATTPEKADSTRAVSVYDGTENTAYITHAGSLYASKSLTIGDKPNGHDSSSLVDIAPSETTPVALNVTSINPSSNRTIIRVSEADVSEADTTMSAYFIGGRTDWFTVPTGYPGVTGNPAYYLKPTQYDLSIPSTPFPAPIRKVETGSFDHNYYILENNELWASGINANGNMGLGDTVSPKPLQRVATDVKDVFAGMYTTFIVKTNGEMYATGYNGNGALGLGYVSGAVNTWTKTSLTDVKLMACGQYSTIAITNSGETWVTGYNGQGRLLIPADVTTWTKLPRTDIVWASDAGETCLYVLSDGSILGAGGNGYNQLGKSGTSSEGKPIKTTLPNGELAIQCVCTGISSYVLSSIGNVYACGNNINGQLGVGHSNAVSAWTKSKIINVAKLISTYGQSAAVKLQNGEVWAIGYNGYGQLGTNNTLTQTEWVKFPLAGIRDFSIGRYHAIMTTSTTKAKKSHNDTSMTGGATIKVVIPNADAVDGSAKQWNTVMIHQFDKMAPVLRIDGLGNVESAGSFFVNGKEVFHPGNMPKIETGNTFDLKDGTKPVVFVRSEAAKDKDNLTFVVEDAVTRITHNNDDASSAFVFTLNNMDSKLTGSNRNTHELIFNGAKGTSSLTLDGNEIYHAGNFVPPDTSNFVHKSYGGYITAPVSIGEDVSAPGVQLGNYQLNVNRPLDTAKSDSGILRIESKDAVVFTGNQQSLFKIVNTVPALKNAFSIYENNYSRSFNVNTQGFCEANEFSAKTRMTVNSEYQGGMVLGLNKSTPGSEWFYIAPRIKDSEGVLSLDTGKMLSYEVKNDTWASISKFTAYNDLLVGCAHTTRPQASSFANHRVTVRAPQGMNGMLISAEDGSPSALTLMHSKNATTGTLMRILASDTLSPNAGAIATYPKFTNAVQGDPSFQLMMNGDISGTGNINLNNKNAGFVATFTNSKSLSSPGGQGAGIQVTTSDGGTLISGINNANSSGPKEVFSVDSGGTFIADGGIRTNGMSYFGHENPQGFLTNEGTGSGLAFEMTKDNKDEAKIALGADTLAFKGAPASSPPGQPYGYQTTLLKLNRISGNAEIPEGVLVAKHPIVHNVVGDAGDWWAGTVIKNAAIPNTESWKTFGKAGYGIHGSGTTVDSFYVGFGPRPWDGVDAACAFRVLPDGSVQSKNAVYGALSDERIKTDIHSTSGKLDDLLKVNIVNYRLKAEPDTKMLGVVAQELEQIFPGMVDTDDGGLKSVKYSIFTPMLVKGVQELHALTVEQDKKIEQLNYEVQELKEAIRAIPMLMKEIEDLKRSK